MSVLRILESFERWRATGRPLVMATVYETLGSTYTKAGHRILIDANGDYQGLVSGGCLEGDLAQRATQAVADGRPIAVSYDLRDEADDLFGLGVGCNGLLRVFLQPLDASHGYEPFASIAARLREHGPSVVATVIESATPETSEAGGTLVWTPEHAREFGLDRPAVERLGTVAANVAAAGRAVLEQSDQDGLVLYAPLKPIPRLLVLGAGLDAVPLVAMAATLGWRVWVADHRPAYIERGGFEAAEQARVIDPAELGESHALESFDAVIVMSHHLMTDETYLRQLADAQVRYVGVLGPPKRKARLLESLGEAGRRLAPRLRGPVGIDVGADSPESIALSILAELQATFAGYPRTS